MNEDQLKIVKTIHYIAEGKGNCDLCPNFKNKPKNEGCGLDKCLDIITELSSSLITKS